VVEKMKKEIIIHLHGSKKAVIEEYSITDSDSNYRGILGSSKRRANV
jgi:hypothetical protein